MLPAEVAELRGESAVGDLPADAESVLRRLEGAFEQPFTLDGDALRMTASIGRAVLPDHADSADGLLRHADASMFEAKRGFVNPR